MAQKFSPDDTMIEIMKDVSFYTDKNNNEDVYIEFKTINGGGYFGRKDSQYFLSVLANEYRKRTGLFTDPDFETFVKIKSQDAIATQAAPVLIQHRLTGSFGKRILYSLGDKQRQCVLVTPKGWKLVPSTKATGVKFLHTNADRPQAIPVGGGDYLKLLRPYINLPDDDFKLLAVCIAQFFSRKSSHFALIISSDKGTGKSTLTKLIQKLIDPSKIDANAMPYKEEDLKVHLAGTYLACFDNTACLKTYVSNLLCAAITGSTAVKRKLYTDADQVVLSLHNVIVLNGIEIIPVKSDLIERSLLFELQSISEKDRKTDDEFWTSFDKDMPAILGAIFDTLSKAMKILPTLQVENLCRMADAHKEMLAIAIVLGIPQEEFTRILYSNLDKLQDAYTQSNSFVELILDYMSKRPGGINAPAQKLFQELKDSIVGATDFFPKSPNKLSQKLIEEKDALLKAGYTVGRSRKATANYIQIAPVPKNQQTREQKAAISARAKLLDDAANDEEDIPTAPSDIA